MQATDSSHNPATPKSVSLHDMRDLVDHAKTLDCIHCGLCLQSCPTFRLSGAESSSPRGRVHLMRAVGEGRLEPDSGYADELDFCLLCRHCESVCPAGVQFGSLMEYARDHVERAFKRPLLARIGRHIGFRRVLPNRWALRGLASLLRLIQVLRLDSVAARLGGERGRALAELPRIPPLRLRRRLEQRTAAVGPTIEVVAVLEGCVMPELFAHVNRATVRSLSALGIESRTLPGVVCCGSLQAHNGDLSEARRLARTVLDGYAQLTKELGQPPRVAIHSAGCGAHLRELQQLFEEDSTDYPRASAFSAQVVDYSEVVAPLLAARPSAADSQRGELPLPIAWDDPCHLCHAQGVRQPPRAILRNLGLPTVPLSDPESCCGSAGIYSLLRPADAREVFARKERDFVASGAATLVTANPGCHMQWQAGLRRAGHTATVKHLAELVNDALASGTVSGQDPPLDR